MEDDCRNFRKRFRIAEHFVERFAAVYDERNAVHCRKFARNTPRFLLPIDIAFEFLKQIESRFSDRTDAPFFQKRFHKVSIFDERKLGVHAERTDDVCISVFAEFCRKRFLLYVFVPAVCTRYAVIGYGFKPAKRIFKRFFGAAGEVKMCIGQYRKR